MLDYYDRLEQQLAELTEQGAHTRGRNRWRPSGPRIRWELVWAAATVAVVIAVGAVFLAARGNHRTTSPEKHPPVHHRAGATVFHNYARGKPPTPAGSLFCDADLVPPGTPLGTTPATSGIANVYNAPPTNYQLSVGAKGLHQPGPGEVYAIWIEPATQESNGSIEVNKPIHPQRLGVVAPTVGADGKLVVQGLVPQADNESVELLITLDHGAASREPGRTVLEGFLPL